MSHYYNSEASYCTYGCYERRKVIRNVLKFDEVIKKEFNRRSSKIVWFVSNCASKFRNKFVPELSKYTPVKIYGKCGPTLMHQNPKVDLTNVIDETKCGRDEPCQYEIYNGNKFFMSIENTNCSNYITEKFWRSLEFNLIPVVVFPPKSQYDLIAPKGSFIHAEDFGYDPERLGDYLKSVASNIALYSKYFEWKRYFNPIFDALRCEQNRICELCHRLNTEKKHYYYDQVSSYFNDKCSRE